MYQHQLLSLHAEEDMRFGACLELQPSRAVVLLVAESAATASLTQLTKHADD